MKERVVVVGVTRSGKKINFKNFQIYFMKNPFLNQIHLKVNKYRKFRKNLIDLS